MLCFQGLEEPQPVLGVYKGLQIPKAIKYFPVRVKHIRTPNEVCFPQDFVRLVVVGDVTY